MQNAVLITGGSGGIGLAFAHEFASRGYATVLVGTNEEKLAHAKHEVETAHAATVVTKALDLSGEGASQVLFNWCAKQRLGVHVLVNNAGYGIYGNFCNTDWEREERLVRLQVLNAAHLTKLFVPAMLHRREGGIINVASTAAFQPGPLMAVYFACKAFMLSFTQALAEELRGSGVHATALCPGPTATDFQKTVGNDNARLKTLGLLSTPAYVARYGYRAFAKRKVVAIPEFRDYMLATLVRFLPRNFVTRTVHRLERMNRVEKTPTFPIFFRNRINASR